jgi:hypothetical protein
VRTRRDMKQFSVIFNTMHSKEKAVPGYSTRFNWMFSQRRREPWEAGQLESHIDMQYQATSRVLSRLWLIVAGFQTPLFNLFSPLHILSYLSSHSFLLRLDVMRLSPKMGASSPIQMPPDCQYPNCSWLLSRPIVSLSHAMPALALLSWNPSICVLERQFVTYFRPAVVEFLYLRDTQSVSAHV